MRIHLTLTIMWSIIGVGLLVAPYVSVNAPAGMLNFGNVQISAGWIVLLLAAYNFIRWYGLRTRTLERQEEEALWERRHHVNRASEPPPAEPDPNFDFRDPPASGSPPT